MSKHPYIVRFEYGSSKAWFLRLEYSKNTFRKLFSDSRYGGRAQALQAAIEERDVQLKARPKPPYRTTNMPTGGVIERVTCKFKRNGTTHVYKAWQGRLQITPAKPTQTKWSIDKWGSKVAFENAKTWLLAKQAEQRQNYKRLGVELPKDRPITVFR